MNLFLNTCVDTIQIFETQNTKMFLSYEIVSLVWKAVGVASR